MSGADAKVKATIDLAIERVLKVYGSWRRDTPIAQMRIDWDRLFWSDAVTSKTQSVSANGVDALWVEAPGVDTDRVLVYFHGGGFKLGSVRSHRDLMARISGAANCRVLGLEYRLAPEHRFPAPIEDAVAAYRWLLKQGTAGDRIAFAGDSAGGGLAISAMFALREQRLPLPAAAVLLSAWTDLTAESKSYQTRAQADPIHQRPMIIATARNYLGDRGDPRDPLASPLFGDLTGLPPVLLQVGDRETGLDDSHRFAEKARDAGVEVRVEVYNGMIHVFQQFPEILPEASQAIDSIGRFLQGIWSHSR
ncbi:MAG: esterase [Hydrocarboniphaga sp.]|uniref:alpha/beta hydrolase n=1 Tax=Hydrocarboniphaga sp. TaxID=2033016 RepID=UPI002605A5CD|nr:alpha/beta hydrolase [Hydrocarboniphaga sp.]MDB5969669.1 esterase [Hydrocarboniphaga sp.]